MAQAKLEITEMICLLCVKSVFVEIKLVGINLASGYLFKPVE